MAKIRNGKYRHFKGGMYKVLGIVKNSETLEDLVLYETLNENPKSKLWVRPVKIFSEKVELNGKMVARFEYLKEKK